MGASRALVLTGGGIGGTAWEFGLLIGLIESGVNLASADLIVGTSAGSVTGAELACGHNLRAAMASFRKTAEASGGVSTEDLRSAGGAQQIEYATDHDRMLGYGQIALATETFPEERMVAGFAQFAEEPFPKNYACTAIDCETGELAVWNAKADVSLDRAVASSCGAPGIFPPITINGRRYYDGGISSATNAQLAKGYDKVLVLHMKIVLPDPGGGGKGLFAPDAYIGEKELLLDSGSLVETVDPSDAVVEAIGINLMDPASIPIIIDASIAQGRALAPRLTSFWN